MILKASQRGGPRQLAAHLLNRRDNDHVHVAQLRGFVADDLYGAMAETVAIAKGTRCRQPIFSLSLNPPKDETVAVDDLMKAADRVELTLRLEGLPRAIVIHEKNGRRHAHVVWSRIDTDQMKAVNLPFFKIKLKQLSKELYLEHEWTLPDGHREHGWKNPLNFTLAEWQYAKRHDLDPREIKLLFQDAWQRSDGIAAFRNALEERGYFLARGDSRNFVAVDLNGAVYAIPRFCGVKAKDVMHKLGSSDHLDTVETTIAAIERRKTERVRTWLEKDKLLKAKEAFPLDAQLHQLKSFHQKERALLNDRQTSRQTQETKERSERLRRGLATVIDLLTGRLFAIKKQNEREAYEAFQRDKAQREALADAQLEERRILQEKVDELARFQRARSRKLVRHLFTLVRSRSLGRSLSP